MHNQRNSLNSEGKMKESALISTKTLRDIVDSIGSSGGSSGSPSSKTREQRLSVNLNLNAESLVSLGTRLEYSYVPSSDTFTSDFLVSEEKLLGLDLTSYEKLVVTGAFSEVIEQLNIIKNYLPYPKFEWKKAYEDPDTRILKINGKISELIFPPYHEYEHSPLWKVQLDRYIIQKVIEDTKNEILWEGRFSILTNFLSEVEFVKKQEDIVIKENTHLKRLVCELKKVVVPKLSSPSSESHIEDIFATEDEMMLDERIKMGIEERYIDAWETARVDQNTMRIVIEENDLAEKLETLAIDHKLENRINNEISTFLLIEIAKLDDMITEWTNIYNRELEIYDTKILQLTSEKEALENKMKNILSKFQNQREVIEELTKFFDEFMKEQELHNKRVQAAALIQYWWRKYLAIKRDVLGKDKKPKKPGKKK